MFSLREYRKPVSRLPDFLPWAGMVAPGVVLGKDGTLQKTFAFRGPDLATAAVLWSRGAVWNTPAIDPPSYSTRRADHGSPATPDPGCRFAHPQVPTLRLMWSDLHTTRLPLADHSS